MIRAERQGDGSIVAVGDVRVGVDARAVRVPLGRYGDEVEPDGLRNTPVAVVSTPDVESLVRVGAERAGRASVGVVRDDRRRPLGARLLDRARETEVVVVVVATASAAVETLTAARALEGRPLAAIPLGEPDVARDMLARCWVDLDIAVPALEGSLRAEVRGILEDLGALTAHHVVEVDPRPGFGDRPASGSSLSELAAAATGVLAGRIAASNRRWR